MKSRLLILTLLVAVLVTSAPAAEDVRSRVVGTVGRTGNPEIDPDSHAYGVPFGSSEDDLIKAMGKPTGYVRLTGKLTTMLYGSGQAFVFSDGKLAGLLITSQVLDWRLSNLTMQSNPFDMGNWRLKNGIFTSMGLKKVRGILGDKLKSDSLDRFYFETAHARVDLDFMQYSNRGVGDESQELYGIFIRHETGGFKQTAMDGGFHSYLDQTFGGVGMSAKINSSSAELEIISVAQSSPAAKAGITNGMLIRSVDGSPVKGLRLDECIELIRGTVGTEVALEVFDPASNGMKTFKLVRTAIAPGEIQWPGASKTVEVTTGRVLRIETDDGARGWIQLIGAASQGGFGDGAKVEETATYRWKYRESDAAPVLSGTNTVTYRYSLKLIGPNSYEHVNKDPDGKQQIKVGGVTLDWSYGHTNKCYIYCVPATLKTSLHTVDEYEKAP